MSLAKVRLKMLQKIAQAQGAQNAPGGATTNVPATSNNVAVPTDPSPPASQLYPIRNGFDSARVAIIDGLVKQLSVSANIATGGKYNLQTLKNQNFQFDPSGFGSTDQKNLMIFFQKVFNTLLNRGQNFAQPVTPTQLKNMVAFLLQSPELSNLSQVSPTGQIAQHAPIQGNFKNTIREQLGRLQPTVPTSKV